MIIKNLYKKDAQLICDLYKNGFLDGWNVNQINESFDSNRFLSIGAFINEKIVGVITISTTDFDADLESIFVLEDFRRSGVATALFNEAEKQIKSKKIEKLFLEVRKSNLTAINFYVKLGFNKISERKKYYSDGEDAVIFVKEYKYQ